MALLDGWIGGCVCRSVELTWEEVMHAIRTCGFEVLEEDVVRDVPYSSNPAGMMRTIFTCALCVVRKPA